jgi:hypothetical protein
VAQELFTFALHYAYEITFRETGAFKIFENHLGHAFIQSANLQFGPGPAPPQPEEGAPAA